MAGNNSLIFLDDKKQIESYLNSRSESMYNYCKESDARFTLWSKNLMHSDLTNKGKRNGPKEGLEKNYLYYLSLDEMNNILAQSPENKFECAKQSNIEMSNDFFKDINIPRIQRREGPQTENHKWIRINDTLQVYLVNDSLKYFNLSYTEKVMNALGKAMPDSWRLNTYRLNPNSLFTEIELHEAIHGLGVKEDEIFHALRLNMFLNDTIIFVVEHRGGKPVKLFILLEKNPRFFTLIGETDVAWENYLTTQRRQERCAIEQAQELDTSADEKSRNLQSAWKNKLAQEMMTYTTEEGKVFCPFTGIGANFKAFSMLFVASHIIGHKDCATNKESYDINNGLLLSANADALFDKHMITVSEDKKLLFSFMLKSDQILCSNLLLNQPLFHLVLNEQRMKNLAEHRRIFFEKEEERKKSGY